MPIRWSLASALLVVFLTGCQRQSDVGLDDNWERYKSRFVAEDGRVIDTGNGNVSHSEGQGYGMIIAVTLGDKDAFEHIWQWTRNNLQLREDALFIWRRRPGIELAEEDVNNASDGDIIIAWALFEAAAKWQESGYELEAERIIQAIKQKLIIQNNGKALILPGEHGFQTQDKMTLNLSYWVYPALKTFSVRDKDPVWKALMASGQALLRQARFGRWQLPPDWLELTSDNTMTASKQGRFGYDAVRIPLYLVFAGIGGDVLKPFAESWTFYQGYTPAWLDLNDNVMDSYGAGSGIKAIKQITLAAFDRVPSAQFDSIDEVQDYYSATLLLLSQISDRRP